MTAAALVERDTTANMLHPKFWPVEVPWGGILNPSGCPVPVTMWWNQADPYAVTFEFRTARSKWVSWQFDRGLLALALIGPVGDGDVQMDLWAGALILTLDSPAGHAEFLFDPNPVADFLRDTYQVVQLGTEQLGVDWDAEFAAVAS